MNTADFVIGQLSLLAWREGKRLSPGCRPAYLGIAQIIRNRVESGWLNGDWLKIIEEVPLHSANDIADMDWRSLPDIYDKDFRWLHSQVSMVYDRTLPDAVTSSASTIWAAHQSNAPRPQPRKGLFYANLQIPVREWFKDRILGNLADHPRLAEAGTITFFG